MPEALPQDEAELLAQLSELVDARTGLALDNAQWLDLRRAVALVAADVGRDWRDCAQWLLSTAGRSQLPLLIDQLTIGETYFFRDDALFAALRERVLPELIAQRRAQARYLKLWSAGCSSGEEPYSLAIELARTLPDIEQWSILLLATDINRRFLHKAERGIYGTWSLRQQSPAALAPYLKSVAKDRFEIAPALRRLVSFAPLNLAVDDYPSHTTRTVDMDLILCRHVLMYLRPDVIRRVIERLTKSLADGGWLITSSIEAGFVDQPELEALRLHDIVLFRKHARAIAPRALAGAPVSAPIAAIHYEPPPARALNKTDISAAALLKSARALADQGRLDEARAECARAIALDKLNSEAHFLQATILLELGAAVDAERELQRTLYLDSDCISAHVALAMLSLRTQRRGDAARHFHRARDLLRILPRDTLVAGSDGLTAQQLSDMIDTLVVA